MHLGKWGAANVLSLGNSFKERNKIPNRKFDMIVYIYLVDNYKQITKFIWLHLLSPTPPGFVQAFPLFSLPPQELLLPL